METIVTILQALQFNALEVFAVIAAFFSVGYWFGTRKTNRMQKRIYKLENDMLDLNAELLYGKDEARIIEIRNSSEKNKNVAN
ncbi:MAG: hypothetical protein JST47_07320 [Bacteroidetes bacterium]|nr:hypothetical protein [Bacteroidota bacterium]MBS1975143.1 hypothetical protein [Bacteroidota bacterium]